MTFNKHVLIVDDEVEVTAFFSYFFKRKRCQVTTVHSGREVKQLLAEKRIPFDLALVDLKLPDADGLDLLAGIKSVWPSCEVVVMTGYSTVKSAVTAMHRGARDYLEKPFDDLDSLEQLLFSILDEATVQSDEWLEKAADYGIYCTPDSPLACILAIAAKLAPKAINVLIEGETGTGKELLARFIHGLSARSQHPFVGINCGAMPENLLESELFGHERGAFTGALKERRGFFELANNGTLFLDEIGEAPLSTQIKLLRVMETGEYMRIGGEEARKSNIRFLAATNRNLQQEVERQRFRSDLLYRLEGVKLTLPPLRERPNDILLIIQRFADRKLGKALRVAPDALELLKRYSWPGNIRQLLNVINQCVALHECDVLQAAHLPDWLHDSTDTASSVLPGETLKQLVEREGAQLLDRLLSRIDSLDNLPFEELMQCFKRLEAEAGRRIIEKGLAETKGNRELLSNKLRISKRTIRYILNEK